MKNKLMLFVLVVLANISRGQKPNNNDAANTAVVNRFTEALVKYDTLTLSELTEKDFGHFNMRMDRENKKTFMTEVERLRSVTDSIGYVSAGTLAQTVTKAEIGGIPEGEWVFTWGDVVVRDKKKRKITCKLHGIWGLRKGKIYFISSFVNEGEWLTH
jgi:hypothetical protein